MAEVGLSEFLLLLLLAAVLLDSQSLIKLVQDWRRLKIRFLSWKQRQEDALNRQMQPDPLHPVAREVQPRRDPSMNRENTVKIRQRARALLKEVTTEQRVQKSAEICHNISQFDLWATTDYSAFFYPTQQEPDLRELFLKVPQGKLLLPRILNSEGKMDFAIVENLAEDLKSGVFGIPDPKPDLTPFGGSGNLTIFVPGLAFGPKGERVGRGKGYYDRILAKFPDALRVGICFDVQMFRKEEVPQQKHDQAMDYIVTESEIVRTGNRS